MKKKIKPTLSYSKLTTYKSCSWKAYCTYHLKLPRTGNSGSSRGSVTHYVLECLSRPDRKQKAAAILKSGSISTVPSVRRLAEIHARKLDVADPANMNLINSFILVALDNDFYCDGAAEVHIELPFNVEREKYVLNGFLDKIAVFEDRVQIIDYKTSKQKANFDVDATQAMLYELIVEELFKKPVYVDFLFLKFPKNPNVTLAPTSAAKRKYFLEWIDSMADYIAGFDENRARTNYAKNGQMVAMHCGKKLPWETKDDGSPVHCCEYKMPRKYWVLKKGKEVLKSSFENNLRPGKGEKVEELFYSGCPAWAHLWEEEQFD